ncbi:MAG: ATP synthase subunit I [Actinomycetota bacterium]
MTDPMLTRLEGPAPEQQIAFDLVKRSLPFAPIWIGFCAIIWGADGALSAGYGLGLILCNFVLAGAMLAWAARISIAFLMGAALFGFLIRLGLIFIAVWLVQDAAWIEWLPLGLTIIVAHLGLLAWETRYVSASLAYPSLKPTSRTEG